MGEDREQINLDDLESVSGISRFHEMLWIERNEEGKIGRLFNRQGEEVPLTELHKSFEAVAEDGGLTYKGEFIPMEDSRTQFKKRALRLQRRNSRHPKDHF
ncbi:MAG: hypothetical protein PQJ59_08135 [Spirochaetales bacterium]|nr:hypothetical protein [Spirochaetales bacterium]